MTVGAESVAEFDGAFEWFLNAMKTRLALGGLLETLYGTDPVVADERRQYSKADKVG